MTTEGQGGETAAHNGNGLDPSPAPVQALQVEISLRPVQGSDRPVLSNFAVVQGAPGMVMVDFGFLDPRSMNVIGQAGRAGAKPAAPVVGQLATRVAMDVQTASQLARQLGALLQKAPRQAPAGAATGGSDAAAAAAAPG